MDPKDIPKQDSGYVSEADNVVEAAFMELYVTMQSQGAKVPDQIKGLLLQMFAAGSVASLHMLSEGAPYGDGDVIAVSMADIHEAASEILSIELFEDSEEEDFDPEEDTE